MPSFSVLDEAAKYASIATAAVAGIALAVAVASILVQRGIAKRRAAIDFFFKTEMDKSIVDAYHAFESAMEKFKEHGSVENLYNDEADYRSVRAYLNIHELVAVGIHKRVLDEKVCFDFWSDELMDAYEDGKPLIEYLRTLGSEFAYTDLEKLNNKWVKWDEKAKKTGNSASSAASSENRRAGAPLPNEWDRLVVKMGALTLAVGVLEMAIITMVCRILGQTEDEIGHLSNREWCKKLIEVAPTSWSDDERADLKRRLEEIRELYRGRNQLIHAALGLAGDGSIAGVPAGSVVDLRTYGVGFTSQKGNTFTIGIVGKRVDLDEIDRLTADVQKARIGLRPYMDLVDKIRHASKMFPMTPVGKPF